MRQRPPAQIGRSDGASRPEVTTFTGFAFCSWVASSAHAGSSGSVAWRSLNACRNACTSRAARALMPLPRNRSRAVRSSSACTVAYGAPLASSGPSRASAAWSQHACTTRRSSRASASGSRSRKAIHAARRSGVAAREFRNSPFASSWLRSKNQPLPCLGSPSRTLSSWLPSTHCARPACTQPMTRSSTAGLSGPRSQRSPTNTARRPAGWLPSGA